MRLEGPGGVPRSSRRRSGLLACAVVVLVAAAASMHPGGLARVRAAATPHTCPSGLTAYASTLGAELASMDCHQLPDLTVGNPTPSTGTTPNNFTDHGPTTGMGFPPPGTGSLNSNHTAN